VAFSHDALHFAAISSSRTHHIFVKMDCMLLFTPQSKNRDDSINDDENDISSTLLNYRSAAVRLPYITIKHYPKLLSFIHPSSIPCLRYPLAIP